jgi:hypothetical protein
MKLSLFGLAAALLATGGLGCSSKSSPQHDGAAVSEAGAIDGSPRKDVGRSDVRDAGGIDSAGLEAGGGRDAKDAPSARDTRDAGPVGVDGPGVRDGNRDSANRDGLRDTSSAGDEDALDEDTPAEPDLPRAPLVGTCASPIEIPYLPSITLTGDTTGSDHALDFPCAPNVGDVVFKIRTDGKEMVYADTFGTGWNTALFFSEACDGAAPPADEGMVVCNDDACGTGESQAYATLPYGYHYLIVSGINGEGGPFTLHVEHAMLGNGIASTLPAGEGAVAGVTSGFDSSRTCDMVGPKTSYWWTTCPNDAGGGFHASTCGGSDWDSALILQVPRLGDDGVACADDDAACGLQSTVDSTIPAGAGMAVLTVTGNLLRSYGPYTLTYARP